MVNVCIQLTTAPNWACPNHPSNLKFYCNMIIVARIQCGTWIRSEHNQKKWCTREGAYVQQWINTACIDIMMMIVMSFWRISVFWNGSDSEKISTMVEPRMGRFDHTENRHEVAKAFVRSVAHHLRQRISLPMRWAASSPVRLVHKERASYPVLPQHERQQVPEQHVAQAVWRRGGVGHARLAVLDHALLVRHACGSAVLALDGPSFAQQTD